MQRITIKHLQFAVLLGTLAGCKSDADRLQDLRFREAMAHGGLLGAQQALEAFTDSVGPDHFRACSDAFDASIAAGKQPTPIASCLREDSLYAKLRDAQNEYDIVQRDLNRFMD